MTGATRIRVATGSPYDVIVGPGVLGEVVQVLPGGARLVGVVHSPSLRATAREVASALSDAGLQPCQIEVPDGEAAKTIDVATSCWQRLGALGFTRSDALVAIGGGATTDVAGFVAATFLRGLALVQVPTTLLAMVDAAVGGKTGINTAEGKNLVGAFHEPTAVICDLGTLETLPLEEMASGLGEIIKCGFIADEGILRLVEANPAAALQPGTPGGRDLIERAIAVKAAAVSGDLREATSTGSTVGREALNYGHTLGHAVEWVERYRLRHGAAVSVGLVYVAELAGLAGRLDAATVQRHRDVLSSVGLPTTYARAGWDELRRAMSLDKKARGNSLRFVVLEAVGRPAILEAPEEDLLLAAYERIS